MYLVHESADGRRRVLARDVETADSLVDQARGLMFRDSVPADYALVFRFHPGLVERIAPRLPAPLDGLGRLAQRRSIHMAFVKVPLDVLWLRDGEVVQVETLRPWRGLDAAPADTVVELAGGAAADVEPGDRVVLRDSLTDEAARAWRHDGYRGRNRRGRARGTVGRRGESGTRPGARSGSRSTRQRRSNRRGRR